MHAQTTRLPYAYWRQTHNNNKSLMSRSVHSSKRGFSDRNHRINFTGIFSLSNSTYTVNHKKGGSTFVTITLENLHRF